MKTAKKIIVSLLTLFSLCTFSSCADMGVQFSNDEAYGEGYDVNFVTSARKTVYDGDGTPITDYYNSGSVNNFETPDEMSADTYCYLTVHPNQDVDIDEFYFYACASLGGTISCRFFVTDYIPSKALNMDTMWSDIESFLNDSSNEGKVFSYDSVKEPATSTSLSATSRSLTAGKWKDIGFTSFQNGDQKLKSVHVSTDQYMLVQICNNVDTQIEIHYGDSLTDIKNTVNERRKNRISIQMTDIMIHAC